MLLRDSSSVPHGSVHVTPYGRLFGLRNSVRLGRELRMVAGRALDNESNRDDNASETPICYCELMSNHDPLSVLRVNS